MIERKNFSINGAIDPEGDERTGKGRPFLIASVAVSLCLVVLKERAKVCFSILFPNPDYRVASQRGKTRTHIQERITHTNTHTHSHIVSWTWIRFAEDLKPVRLTGGEATNVNVYR